MTNHYVYKITVNTGEFKGHWYIGKRTCHCSIDKNSYMGSGVVISQLTPVEDCTKEILSVWNSSDDAYDEEARIVNRQLLLDPLCLNRCTGGGRDKGKKTVYLPDWATMFENKFGYLTITHEIIATKLCMGIEDEHFDKVSNAELKAIRQFVNKQDRYPENAKLIYTKPCKPIEIQEVKKVPTIKSPPKKKTTPVITQSVIPPGYTKPWYWDGKTYIKNN